MVVSNKSQLGKAMSSMICCNRANLSSTARARARRRYAEHPVRESNGRLSIFEFLEGPDKSVVSNSLTVKFRSRPDTRSIHQDIAIPGYRQA